MSQSPASPPTPQATPLARIGLGAAWWALLGGLALAGLAALLLVQRTASPPSSAKVTLALEPSLLPKGSLVRAASPLAIPPIDDPQTLTREEAEALKLSPISRYLKSKDLVVGVALGGEACAYPLRVLEWHEVINHRLGGVPLLVTYHPLCDAARVFARLLPGDEEPRRFAASGLLFNSTLILREQVSAGAEASLWSQLQARAVSGPAAAQGHTLKSLPAQVLSWADWSQAHPETRVLGFDPARKKLLKRAPYRNYRGSDLLRFPVEPLPPPGLAKKTPVLVVEAGAQRRIYPLPFLLGRADSQGIWRAQQGPVQLEFSVKADPLRASVIAVGGEPLKAFRVSWFAWYSTHPQDALRADLPRGG